jgi:uncharacterized damage-inducible protein DinB
VEIREIDGFLSYWERVRERTRRVAALIPDENLEWTYRLGKYTLGDLVRHLAGIERYMYAENVQDRPSRYPGHGRELADGSEAVRGYFERLHAESMAIFRALTPEDLKKKVVTPGGAPLTTWKWLRAMVEHEVHHRGQMYVYLGILGIATPPLYGLTEEEVRAASAVGAASVVGE